MLYLYFREELSLTSSHWTAAVLLLNLLWACNIILVASAQMFLLTFSLHGGWGAMLVQK